MRPFFKLPAIICLALAGVACTSVPDGIEPVQGFDSQRYLGTWYEIARLDHSFERGLEQVSANYSEREDGGITVINKGYSPTSGKWSQAEGRAYFVGESDIGLLKVSFFGPFYGSYVVFSLDDDYHYSMVAGPTKSYLWLLARTPAVDQNIIDEFTAKATTLGFDTSQLIFVKQ